MQIEDCIVARVTVVTKQDALPTSSDTRCFHGWSSYKLFAWVMRLRFIFIYLF